MTKRRGLILVFTLICIGAAIVLLLAHHAAAISPLKATLRKVKVGMTIAEIETIFGSEPDMLLRLDEGSDLHVWRGGRDDRASVVVLDGRATKKAWARLDPSIVEKLERSLGMPWWEYDRDIVNANPVDDEDTKTAASKLLGEKDPRIEAIFPGKPMVETTPDGKLLMLEPNGGLTVFLLNINKLPARIPVAEDPTVGKKYLDVMQDATIKSQKGTQVVFAKDFLFDGKYPARVLEHEVPGMWSYRSYFILTPHYSYKIGVGGTRRFVVSGRAYRFMNSFKVIE